MSESYWWYLFHKEGKSWDSTTCFSIWQFQTTAWKRYLQMHLLAERFGFLVNMIGVFWKRIHDLSKDVTVELITRELFFCLHIHRSMHGTISMMWKIFSIINSPARLSWWTRRNQLPGKPEQLSWLTVVEDLSKRAGWWGRLFQRPSTWPPQVQTNSSTHACCLAQFAPRRFLRK